MTYTVPARPFAAAWLNVALAASDDEERPQLCRAVHVEFLPDDEVRLFATDSYMAFWCTLGEAGDDVLPERTVIARDLDKRAQALMKFAFADAKGDADALIRVGVRKASEVSAVNALFDTDVLTIQYKNERLALALYEGEPLKWRSLVTGRTPGATESMALSPWLLGRFGKLISCSDTGNPMQISFAGSLGAALLTVAIEPELGGLIMPVRADSAEAAA